MNDILGNELKVGDIIVYGTRHAGMNYGVITELKITDALHSSKIKALVVHKNWVGNVRHYTVRKTTLSNVTPIVVVDPSQVRPEHNERLALLLKMYIDVRNKQSIT